MFFRLSLITSLAFFGLACGGTSDDSASELVAWEPGPVPLLIEQKYKFAVEVNPDDQATDELREACKDSCVVREIPGKTGTMTTPMGDVPSYQEPHKVLSDCCAVIENNGRYYHVVHFDRNVDY